MKLVSLNVGKQFTFESAHFIAGHPTCGMMHGHTWTLDVVLKGAKLNPNTCMVIDFKILSGIVKDVLNKLDHKIINDVVDFAPVTAETLAPWIAKRIVDRLSMIAPDIQYACLYLKLQEGPGGYVEYIVGDLNA